MFTGRYRISAFNDIIGNHDISICRLNCVTLVVIKLYMADTVLVQEVVSTLTIQDNSQVAGQVCDSVEGSSPGITSQTLAITGTLKIIVRKA